MRQATLIASFTYSRTLKTRLGGPCNITALTPQMETDAQVPSGANLLRSRRCHWNCGRVRRSSECAPPAPFALANLAPSLVLLAAPVSGHPLHVRRVTSLHFFVRWQEPRSRWCTQRAQSWQRASGRRGSRCCLAGSVRHRRSRQHLPTARRPGGSSNPGGAATARLTAPTSRRVATRSAPACVSDHYDRCKRSTRGPIS